MPAASHSRPLKLATAALSKIVGVRAAAKVAGVDWRTVERWVKGSEDGDEAEWTAARELAQARHLEALIRGDTRGATQWATSAGISARNQRYAKLISQRDARKAEQAAPAEPEPEKPWVTAFHKLEWPRSRLMYWELLLPWEQDREPIAYQHLPDVPIPDDMPLEDLMLQIVVPHYAALSDEEAQARMPIAEEAEREWSHSLVDSLNPPEPVAAAPEPPQPSPTPPVAAPPVPPQPVNPGLRVLRDDELADFEDQAHLWRRLE